MQKDKKTFEQSVARIDEIVKKLEKGDAALDESLALFEEATGLIRECSKMLDKAEQKVTLLGRDPEGKVAQLPFEGGESE